MKLVIDIPEYMFEDIQDRYRHPNKGDGINLLEYAVAKGIPLPKGHGRIGDLDALREEVSSWGMNDYEPSDFIDAIDEADTILKADKEQEDGND